MSQNNYIPGVDRFKQMKVGDQPSAGEHNKITAAINRIQQAGPQHEKKRTRAIKLLRLTEPIGQFGSGDSSAGHDRSGIVQAYDPDLNAFVDTLNDETKSNIVDGLDAYYDTNDLVWCVYLEQSGKWHPINPTMVRTAVTVMDAPGGDPPYPECDGRVFPFKFVRVTYDRTDSTGETHSYSYLDATDSDPDEYCFNLFEPGEDDDGIAFIPLGTLIWVFKCGEQWFTFTCCFSCPQSSSSQSHSDSSSSDISSSISSESSQSVSQSSSDSSSLSVSDSSSPSSDVSSSVSVSESSGGSSVSISESSGFDCVTVVTSLNFDAETCLLTYCTVTICFPAGLGITVSAESC